jgi:hypothetical protein
MALDESVEAQQSAVIRVGNLIADMAKGVEH